MHLDQWLKQVYDEETLTKEGSGLEVLFDQMDPEHVLEIACGRTTIEKVAEGKPAPVASPGPRPQPKPQGIKKTASAKDVANVTTKDKLSFMDKVARQVARQHHEVAQELEKEAFMEPAIGAGIGAGIGHATGYGAGRGAGVGALSGLGAGLGGGLGAAPGVITGNRGLALLGEGLGALAGGYGGYRGGRAMLDTAKEKKEKSKGKTKEDEFTSPEAQQKAKVMQKSMKMAKGAAPPVRKKLVSQAANAIQGR